MSTQAKHVRKTSTRVAYSTPPSCPVWVLHGDDPRLVTLTDLIKFFRTRGNAAAPSVDRSRRLGRRRRRGHLLRRGQRRRPSARRADYRARQLHLDLLQRQGAGGDSTDK